MEIGNNMKVSIHYTLKDETGQIIDSSRDRGPLEFIHGTGQIIPGVEKALEGRKAGEEFTVVVEPEEGYGTRDESLVYKVPKDHFDQIDQIEIGMRFQVNAGDGPHLANVAAIEEDGIVLDGNHPLADMRLHFEISVLDIIKAAREEIEGCQSCAGCESGECGGGS